MKLYILSVIAVHEFDGIMHQTAHSTYALAEAYAEAVALPEALLGVAAEWHRSVRYSVEEIDFVK